MHEYLQKYRKTPKLLLLKCFYMNINMRLLFDLLLRVLLSQSQASKINVYVRWKKTEKRIKSQTVIGQILDKQHLWHFSYATGAMNN